MGSRGRTAQRCTGVLTRNSLMQPVHREIDLRRVRARPGRRARPDRRVRRAAPDCAAWRKTERCSKRNYFPEMTGQTKCVMSFAKNCSNTEHAGDGPRARRTAPPPPHRSDDGSLRWMGTVYAHTPRARTVPVPVSNLVSRPHAVARSLCTVGLFWGLCASSALAQAAAHGTSWRQAVTASALERLDNCSQLHPICTTLHAPSYSPSSPF
jgi:hypothetical protein